MRFLHSLTPALALLASGVSAASSWGFTDGSVTRVSKSDGDVKQALTPTVPLKDVVSLGAKDSIKIILSAKENGKAKRPHQAFLVIRETTDTSGLDVQFPLTLKENGKGVVEISPKDLPIQHAVSSGPLSARVVIGSFGSAQALETDDLFKIKLTAVDELLAKKNNEAPLRYAKRDLITHLFRQPAKTPPKIISYAFALAVFATIPVVLVAWAALGANINDASKAFGAAPVSHGLFFGSLVAMEGALFLYHIQWTLFQFLPIAAVIGAVAFISGSKALGEVQSRRLAGQR